MTVGPARVVVDYDVATPLRDEVVLRSTVYRPAGAGAWPTLLTRLPYGKDLSVLASYFNPSMVAARGFAVVMQDCRGRFASDGSFESSIHESDDGEDTIAWLLDQPWCDGTVGMWGRSYFSETQWRAALRHPEGLWALALGVSAGGNANNGSIIRGGCVELGSRIGWGHASISLNEIARRHRGDPAGFASAMAVFDATDRGLLDGSLLATLPTRDLAGRVDPFIAREIVPSLAAVPGGPEAELWDSAMAACPVELATLHIGGFFDIFCPTTLAQYRRQLAHFHAGRCPRPRLVLGPWAHTNLMGSFPDVSFGMTAGAPAVGRFGDLSSMHADFFGDALAGRDPNDGALADVPPVLVFVMGENRWHGFDELPSPDRVSWYLGADGGLGPNPAAPGEVAWSFDPLDPAPTVGGATMMVGGFPSGSADQRRVEARDDVVSFTSDALAEPITLFGEVSASIELVTDVVDTDVVVRLCRVLPDGTSLLLCDGVTRASWRDSYAGDGMFAPGHERRLLTPGEPATIDVALWATACTLAPGERLRVDVTSSCFPRWDRNLQTGESTYDSDRAVVGHHRLLTGAVSRFTVGVLDGSDPA